MAEFSQAIQRDLHINLAKGSKITASHTRGRKFSADKMIDENKDSYWATEDNITQATITIEPANAPITFNRLLIQEYIRLGQRVKSFSIEAFLDGKWQLLDSQTTIGYKRILRFPETKTSKIRIHLDAKASPTINNIEIYNAPEYLQAPIISRDKKGMISIKSIYDNYKIVYSLNGEKPDTEYNGAFQTEGKAVVKAMIIDTQNNNQSKIQTAHFDIDKNKWRIINQRDESINKIFDGDKNTAWISPKQQIPQDLVIDLGNIYSVNGFKYLPDQSSNPQGIVFKYTLAASTDGNTWKQICSKEFDNIGNNPIMQTVHFDTEEMRFIKFSAHSTVKGDSVFGCAEFDISTINP